MKSDAYGFASEGLFSYEMEHLYRISRFSLEAITGRRVMLFSEYIRMITAENIVKAFTERMNAESWVTWQKDHPNASKLLTEAEQLYATRDRRE